MVIWKPRRPTTITDQEKNRAGGKKEAKKGKMKFDVKGTAEEYQGFSVLQNTALLITVNGVMFRVRALAQPRSVEPEVTEIRLARVALKWAASCPQKDRHKTFWVLICIH